MTLGAFINQYLLEHDMSMRAFSRASGLSTPYISMLVNGRQNGKRPTPSIDTYAAVASAMGLTTDELIRSVDDTISIGQQKEQPTAFGELSPVKQELIDLVLSMPDEKAERFLLFLQS